MLQACIGFAIADLVPKVQKFFLIIFLNLYCVW